MSTSSDPETATEEVEEPRRSLGRRLAVPLLAGALALGAFAGGLFVAMGPSAIGAMLGGDPPPDPQAAQAGADAGAAQGHAAGDANAAQGHGPAAEALGVMHFDDMIVNITALTATGRVTSRFLKLNIALVYDKTAEGADGVLERELYMRDAFQDYLRQLTERDLQGSIGIVNLKGELLRRARAISGSIAPQELLVADMIIQ